MSKILLLLIISISIGEISTAQNFDKIIKTVNSDRAGGDFFGDAVAISGNFAVVGASFEDEDLTGVNTEISAGSAYIFERNLSGDWVEIQKIIASDRDQGDRFGFSVSISGNYIVVGAQHEKHDPNQANALTDAGSAYIFERNLSGVWIEVQKVVASDRAQGDRFSRSLAISDSTIIIGAFYNDTDSLNLNAISNAGAAYIFELNNGGVWTETQKIVSSQRGVNDYFGKNTAIDSNYIIIGSEHEGHDVSGGNLLTNAGSAYIFEKNISGNWVEVQKIVASDRGQGDLFGYSVDISGNYLVVGAIRADEDSLGINPLSNAGAAYVFERNLSGSWNEIKKIVSSDRAVGDEFGSGVSIFNNKLIVGAFKEADVAANAEAGAVYVFENNGTGNWFETEKIIATDRNSGNSFGLDVSIDNNFILVGSRRNKLNVNNLDTLNSAGAAYFIEPCIPSFTTDTRTECRGFIWTNGLSYFSNNSIAKDSLSDRFGCDSIITLNLTINIVDTTTITTGTTITANATGANYQWIDCNNGNTPITGATSQLFTAISNGDYAVIVTQNSCSDTSACVTIVGVGINENSISNGISIYPNPTNGSVNIDLGNLKDVSVKITDVYGKVVYRKNNINAPQHQLEISQAVGLYFIEVKAEGQTQQFKIIKQ